MAAAELVLRHSWLFFVFVTCANAAVWAWRGRSEIARDPQLAPGYRALIRGWLLYGNLPWLVMGLGVIFGGVPTVFHFLDPRGGVFPFAWCLTVVGLWIASAYWLFFRNGAELLIRHPGFISGSIRQPWVIKAYFLACLAGGVAALVAILNGALDPQQ